MSESYGTEFEIRQEIEKRTNKEILQKLKLWLHRPTEDIRIINTEMLMLEKIEKDLEVLEILCNHLNVFLTTAESDSKTEKAIILRGYIFESDKDFEKVKTRLKYNEVQDG